MTTFVRVIILLVVFAVGYTLGQGHRAFDYDGNGIIDNADFTAVTDRLFSR